MAGTLTKIAIAAAGAAWGYYKVKSSGEDNRKQEPNNRSDQSYGTARAPSPVRRRQPYTYKLNFDGSESKEKDKAGAGFIIRIQSTGEPVISAYYKLNRLYSDMCDIVVATAMGLKLGLEMAKEMRIELSIIQGSRSDVIKWVKGDKPEAKYVKMVDEIKHLMKECGINPKQIEEVEGESENKVARKLAELGRITGKAGGTFWERFALPAEVNKLIDEDMKAN